MATIAWPSTDTAFRLATFSRKQRHNVAVNVSPLSGATQVVQLPGMRWVVTVGLPEQSYAERQRVGGFLASLAGGVNRLALWDFANPQPALLGGAPLINGALAQFAQTLSIDGVIYPGYNLLPNPTLVTGWAAGGTTPPTVSNNVTFLGKGCGSVTFGTGSSTGFAGSRAERTAATAAVGLNTQYACSCAISLSRALTGSETIVVYFSGISASTTLTLSAANSAAYVGAFVRTSHSLPPFGLAGLVYPIVYLSTAVTSSVTVYMAEGQVEVGSAPTAYTGPPALKQGDWLSVPLSTGLTQLLRVTGDVAGETLNAVPVADMLRASVADNAVVTIVKPTGLYVPVDPNALEEPYGGFNRCPATSFDLVEVFS